MPESAFSKRLFSPVETTRQRPGIPSSFALFARLSSNRSRKKAEFRGIERFLSLTVFVFTL